MKEGDIHVLTSCDVSAVAWKDKNCVQMLTNIYDLPAEGNFDGEIGNALRPAMVGDHSTATCQNLGQNRYCSIIQNI